MRGLYRAREDAKSAGRKARQHLSAFLLRNGYHCDGKTAWSKAHWRRISDIKMLRSARQITLQEYADAVRSCLERVDRLTGQIRQLYGEGRLGLAVEALQALRGISLIVAATTVAELGGLVVPVSGAGQPPVAG